MTACFTYSLLSPEDTKALLAEAHRVLIPGGRLGIAGLTHGKRGAARAMSGAWEAIHRLRPSLVGGCRPVEVGRHLDDARWKPLHHDIVEIIEFPGAATTSAEHNRGPGTDGR